MFTKILIANRGESARSACASAKPNCLMRAAHAAELNRSMRAAHAGEFTPMELTHV